MSSPQIGPPAPRPCDSCPYRRDVPSGVWDAAEYDKLRAYDRDTMSQPGGVFQCHQTDRDNKQSRICAGWAGCHGYELLALRFALLRGHIDDATFEAAAYYESPVPLFDSGEEAADHGQAEIEAPSDAAVKTMAKVVRTRSDIRGV